MSSLVVIGYYRIQIIGQKVVFSSIKRASESLGGRTYNGGSPLLRSGPPHCLEYWFFLI